MRVTEPLNVKAKEHVMASVTSPYATNQSKRNERLLRVIKSNQDDNKVVRRDLSCGSYFGRWNKMPSSSGRRAWKFLYFIGTE